jgi:hypothetical protein
MIKYYPDFNDHFKLINCTMVLGEDFQTRTKSCAKEYSIAIQSVLECASGSLGDELLYQAARKTMSLVPKATYIPHIVFDNVHNENLQHTAEFNIRALLCERYKVICLNNLSKIKKKKLKICSF